MTRLVLFPGSRVAPTDFRSRARRELERVSLELAYAADRAEALGAAAVREPDIALRAEAARVRVAALRARAAQLRRAAGRELAPR